MATRTRQRRRTIFFPPKSKRLADIISIRSPSAFRRSIRTLEKGGLDAHEKRALVLAQNRARAMLRKRTLSAKERKEFEAIAKIPLPAVTKRSSTSRRRSGTTRRRSASSRRG